MAPRYRAMVRNNELYEYPFITLPHKEFGSMNDLCCDLNRRISARENGAFEFNYSMEQGKSYISFPFDIEKVILNNNLRYFLGFKQNIINSRSARSTSVMDRVIIPGYP